MPDPAAPDDRDEPSEEADELVDAPAAGVLDEDLDDPPEPSEPD